MIALFTLTGPFWLLAQQAPARRARVCSDMAKTCQQFRDFVVDKWEQLNSGAEAGGENFRKSQEAQRCSESMGQEAHRNPSTRCCCFLIEPQALAVS